MTIDTTRGDWIRVAKVYQHCLLYRAKTDKDPSLMDWGAWWARDLADELAAQDMLDASRVGVVRVA